MTRNKFGAKKTNGYHSKKEAKRAQDLHILESAGIITELEEQVRYEVVPKQEGERSVVYVLDFRYRDATGKLVFEDTKGFRTPDYVIKRKLMLQVYGIRITEI